MKLWINNYHPEFRTAKLELMINKWCNTRKMFMVQIGFKVILGLLSENSENLVQINWMREAESVLGSNIGSMELWAQGYPSVCCSWHQLCVELTLICCISKLSEQKIRANSFLHIFYVFSFQQDNGNGNILRVALVN